MKRIALTRARRLSFLLMAVLLLAGIALGALPAAAAETAPYQAEFYASGQLIATVPFDPTTGIQAVIEVPQVEGYVGEWKGYTLTDADIRIEAIYTPIEGGCAIFDDQAIIFCLLLLIGILLITVLILVILTLYARKILRAHGLWGKGAKANQGQTAEEADASVDSAAQQNSKEKKAEKAAEEKKEATEEKKRSSTGEATAAGKKSNASVEEKAENKEADSDLTPAEASDKQATASDPVSASPKDRTEKKTDKNPRVIPIVAGDGKDEGGAEKQEKTAPKTMADALSSMASDGREDEMSTVLVGKDGRRVQIKCRQSFRARIICACDESKDYYNDLKNYLLSYEDVSAADSLNYESFNGGRRQLAKLNITGKTVILFLALDPAKLEGSKYKYDNVGDRKRYEKTPVKVKVRSERSFKWAKELIDMAMAEDGRPFAALREEQHVPRESLSRSELIRQGLIQVDARDMESGQKVDEATVVRMIEEGAVPEGSRPATEESEQKPDPGAIAVGIAAAVDVAADGDEEEKSLEPVAEESGLDESFTLADMPMMANVSLAPEEEFIPHLEAVTAEEAEVLVENEVAEHHIEHHVEPDAPRVKGKRSCGKPTVLNVDVLDQAYASGERITLARLKADGLVPKKTRSLKILAHGRLTKPLTIEANRFSLTAVKMILLTGGTPVQLD